LSTDLPQGIQKLGITRWVDMLLHFPLRYENESLVCDVADVIPGQFAQVQVRVISARIVFRPRRMLLVDVEDDTGSALLRFIYFKDAQKNAFPVGHTIRVLGDARRSLAGVEFIHPRIRSGWLSPEAIGKQPLLPVYPTTAGVSQLSLRRAVARAMSIAMPTEWLPDQELSARGLLPLPQAIRLLHEPPADAASSGVLEKIIAREGPAWDRIRFDELVAQQILMRRARRLRQNESAPSLNNSDLGGRLRQRLSFALTQAQERALSEIVTDLHRPVPMQRLLQGDVGSGKTVVAALAAAQAVGSGGQVAVMAPTEILASQLFEKFLGWFSQLQIDVVMVKGGMPAKERRGVLEKISNGQAAVVVGTHALIQKGVAFQNLVLAIVDEQHRFGVGQRLALRGQGRQSGRVPHVLGMSATPIPRSLAMTYLADLDVSVLDERPPNRQPIITKLMSSIRRDELADKLHDFISTGGQAYWVCPVIEVGSDDDELQLQAIETAQAWLAPRFGNQLVVLHGRMSADEKQAAMAAFARGDARLMLATTVIEVGVDVPKATIMVIEHAERFGLAQLHQLRGRIGRGHEQSTCILLFDEPLSDVAKERLKTLYETDDGFEVARRDLAIRGPGEFLGVRQSGVPSLRYSDLHAHVLLVEQAVAFGAKLAMLDEPSAIGAPKGITPAALDAVIDRWAFGKETLLASG
jgi:ATP-dependent DNA helicase RecG